MLTNATTTLIKFRENNDEYECAGTFPAWVHGSDSSVKTEKGVRTVSSFDIRFDIKFADTVDCGDYIFIGNKPADIDVSACKKVESVTKNNFGRRPHWHVKTGA